MFRTFLVLLLVTCPSVFSDEPDKKLHEECLYPTVIVKNTLENHFGTGFIVRSQKVSEKEYWNIAITCNHILPKEDTGNFVGLPKYKNWSEFDGYEMYPVSVYLSCQEKDLAVLIFISEHALPTAKLDFDTKLFIGSDVSRIGNGIGDEPRLDFGKITSISSIIPGHKEKTYRSSIFTVPGDSGGPVFYKNKVVGIMQAIRMNYRNRHEIDYLNSISMVIPCNRISNWNKENDNSISFVCDEQKKLPSIDMTIFKLKTMESSILTPKNIWSKK